ncbi:MAG: hypothetical protein ABIR24_06565 [Verrucomicrobiota bacterium]
MKNNFDNDELLKDVLADAAPPSFRDELFARTLQQVRRRKQLRRTGSALLATSAVVVALIFFARVLPKAKVAPTRITTNPLLIHSQPLAANMIVRTDSTIALVNSSSSAGAILKSASAKYLFSVIGDDELFDLLDGRPAILVRRNSFGAELVFANPADQDGFLIR